MRFVDYYTANGWKVGKNPMKDWRAAVRTWERDDRQTVTDRERKKRRDHFSNYKEQGVEPVNLDDIALTLEDEL